MAVLRAYWSESLTPWAGYLYGVVALAGLLVPRAARWGRSWLRARVDERLLLARAAASTPVAP